MASTNVRAAGTNTERRGTAKLAGFGKGQRITGTTRAALAETLKRQYEKGTSIRALAENAGRSYGFIHRVLSESGATMRSRGGGHRTSRSPRPTPSAG